MKHLINLLLFGTILVALTSCSDKGAREVVHETTEIVETSNVALGGKSETLQEFYALLDAEAEDESVATTEFLERIATFVKYNIGGLPEAEADEMILAFEAAQVEALSTIQERFDSIEMQVLFRPFRLRDLRAMDVTGTGVMRELEALSSMGLQIEQAEGSFFPVINYGFYEWFTPYASMEVRMFYELMKVESDYAPQKDGGLAISWNDVLTRAVAFEAYALRFPDGALSERATELYERYRSIALEGTINTPLFDRDSLQMRSEAVTEYKAFAEALALKKLHTDFEKLIIEYMDLLKQSQYAKTEKIASFIDSFR